MLVIVFAAPVYRYWIYHSEPDFSADAVFLDSLVFAREVSMKEKQSEPTAIVYSTFNPNEIGVEEFIQLGFPEFIAKRILQYREKGGIFRIKADLKKIYGLDLSLYNKVESYIQLPESMMGYTPPVEKSDKKVHTKKVIQPFDLNTADTTQLKQIFGIGNVLSERIVKYRTQLGGFISEGQLSEVYRLDSVTIDRLLEHAFIEESFQPAQININLATETELKRHPYVSYTVAGAIVAYRFQHGKFNSLDDLKKIVVLSSDEREKIKPYLIVE
jgi:competence ComEA-like helix-hairpin-helix protein